MEVVRETVRGLYREISFELMAFLACRTPPILGRPLQYSVLRLDQVVADIL
jgi:hypothetical protein